VSSTRYPVPYDTWNGTVPYRTACGNIENSFATKHDITTSSIQDQLEKSFFKLVLTWKPKILASFPASGLRNVTLPPVLPLFESGKKNKITIYYHPHVLGLPDLDPFSQRYGSGSFSFLIKMLSGLK
jgi:hypothetical protein